MNIAGVRVRATFFAAKTESTRTRGQSLYETQLRQEPSGARLEEAFPTL